MLFLKTKQSICPPYAQKIESDYKKELINGNKRKKGETVIAVAKLLIQDFTIERFEMANICGITPQKISSATKKIQETIREGHTIIGLSDKDNIILKANLELRNRMDGRLIREVAKVILRDYRIPGRQIAQELHEAESNICNAIKKIKEQVGFGLEPSEESGKHLGITGLTKKENEELLLKISRREKEILKEKELRQQERELAKASKESMRDLVRIAKRKISKKPATISDEGLADWNRMHYDPVTGALNIPRTSIPGDMPRRYPKKQIAVQLATPDSYLIPGVPPKGSGTASGRRRIGIMHLT